MIILCFIALGIALSCLCTLFFAGTLSDPYSQRMHIVLLILTVASFLAAYFVDFYLLRYMFIAMGATALCNKIMAEMTVSKYDRFDDY